MKFLFDQMRKQFINGNKNGIASVRGNHARGNVSGSGRISSWSASRNNVGWVGGGNIAIGERNTRFLLALTIFAAAKNATPITFSAGNAVTGQATAISTSPLMTTYTRSCGFVPQPVGTFTAEWLGRTWTINTRNSILLQN